MNPLILKRFLAALPDDLAVTDEDRKAIHRCGVALNLDLMHELSHLWEQMLKAPSWEVFLELRGAYKGLQSVIELPEQLSIVSESTKRDEAAFVTVEEQLKGLNHGSSN